LQLALIQSVRAWRRRETAATQYDADADWKPLLDIPHVAWDKRTLTRTSHYDRLVWVLFEVGVAH